MPNKSIKQLLIFILPMCLAFGLFLLFINGMHSNMAANYTSGLHNVKKMFPDSLLKHFPISNLPNIKSTYFNPPEEYVLLEDDSIKKNSNVFLLYEDKQENIRNLKQRLKPFLIPTNIISGNDAFIIPDFSIFLMNNKYHSDVYDLLDSNKHLNSNFDLYIVRSGKHETFDLLNKDSKYKKKYFDYSQGYAINEKQNFVIVWTQMRLVGYDK
jgi:hypothetical protein